MRSPIFLSLLLVACGHTAPAEHGSGSGAEHHRGAHHGHGGHHAHGGHHGSVDHDFSDAEAWARRFEDPERDTWQRPDFVLEHLALTPEMRVADIGSATGYFPIRLARAVPQGRVWGIDVEPAMVRYLNARARREDLGNLFSVLGRPEDPLLPEPVDRILCVDTYHHIADRPGYFRGLLAHLRPGGRLVIIDFTRDSPIGPPASARIPPDQVQRELEEAGYTLTETVAGLPHQFFLVFTPR